MHRAVSSLGLTQGVAHVEFGFTDEGPVLFELGARCGGGHTPQIAHHVSGVNEFIEACRMACGLPPDQFEPSGDAAQITDFWFFHQESWSRITIPDALDDGQADVWI